MWNETLLYAVLICQVLVVSVFLPTRILSRARHVVDTYPPGEYPRLYGARADDVEAAQRRYRLLNGVALVAVVALMVLAVAQWGDPLFQWNGGSVVAGFFMLQFLPLMIAMATGLPYFSMKRLPDLRSTRTAELRARRLLDYASPALLGATALVYVVFVALVAYVRQFEYPWFGGWANVAMITAMNALFAGLIYRALYGKPEDPYQTSEDRSRQIQRTTRVLLFTSMAATGFVALNIGMKAFGLDHLDPIALSIYLQALALIGFSTFRVDNTNFEVYREEPAT